MNTRANLKNAFSTGTAATEAKFSELVDSYVNWREDSFMVGPTGATSSYGMLGPTGGTANGLMGPTGATFYSGMYRVAVPSGWTAAGDACQYAASGATFYYNDGQYWRAIVGSTAF